MDRDGLVKRFRPLTTAHIADACIRCGTEVRCAPASVRPVVPGTRMIGRALPAQHVGSVDVFLEAIGRASAGDVLVVDNGGRLDEGCVGDLVALEGRSVALAGVVIWGAHRDTAEIREIGLPVFSLGACPAGPQRLDPRPANALALATIGAWTVGVDDLVVGDDDGVLFVPGEGVGEILAAAEVIQQTERLQAAHVVSGRPLRDQVHFSAYLAQRNEGSPLTFREHLRIVGGAIEE